MSPSNFPHCSDNQVNELLQLARSIDCSLVLNFHRTVSRTEHGAPWFVWAALANDGREIGRSGEFRFIASNLGQDVSAAEVQRAIAQVG